MCECFDPAVTTDFFFLVLEVRLKLPLSDWLMGCVGMYIKYNNYNKYNKHNKYDEYNQYHQYNQ